MNIITGMVSTYIGYSIVKYAVDCFAAAFFNKSTELISNKAKTTIDYVRGKKKDEKEIEIQYEYLNMENDDEILLVNSKKRKDSLNENWDEFSTEELVEMRKDVQNKEIAKKYSTPRMGPLAPPNTPISGPVRVVPNYDALLIL